MTSQSEEDTVKSTSPADICLSHVPDTVTHIKASLSQINQTIKSSPNAKLMSGVHGGHDAERRRARYF